MHHCAKISLKLVKLLQTNHDYQLLKMATIHHLTFLNSNFLVRRVRGPLCISILNLAEIGQTV